MPKLEWNMKMVINSICVYGNNRYSDNSVKYENKTCQVNVMFLELTGEEICSYCEGTHACQGPDQNIGTEPALLLSTQVDISTANSN